MTTLYYSDTNYDMSPPMDISPLLLRLHKDEQALVICAREGMQTRVREFMNSEDYIGPEIVTAGIWDLNELKHPSIPQDIAVKALLESFDIVIFVGKDRVHEEYQYLIDIIKDSLC